ncbi:MAG: hypothetical protein WC979_03265 [Candidatus Pacearchaeota archaeon]|jgi:hypothetical protein|nr:hypothetical protein [Clostridia bacterium]
MEDKLEKALESLEEWENIKYRMKEEGFHYCFNGYSSWKEINDAEFQKLKDEYIESAKRLEYYVKAKVIETRMQVKLLS